MLSYSTGFTKLPKELTVCALHFCSYQDILRFSATCKAYRELVLNTISLHLQIELGVNHLQLSNGCMRESQQKLLQDLKSYNRNWLDLSLSTGPNIKIARRMRRPIIMGELRSGLLTSVYSRSATTQYLWQADTVEIVSLDEPTSRWTHAFDVMFHQLAIDPDQDLLILAVADEEKQKTLTIYFYSLRTGLVHLSARHPIIVLELEFSVEPSGCSHGTIHISITDEVLVINLVSGSSVPQRNTSCDALVLDWREGCLLHHIGTRHGFCSAVCLDGNRLVVLTAKASIPISASTSPFLSFNLITLLLFDRIWIPRSERLLEDSNIFNISKGHVLAPALALEFPRPKPNITLRVERFQALPASAPTDTTPGQKFTPVPSCQTLNLTMRASKIRSRVQPTDYAIFIDVRRILHHLSHVPSQAPTDPLPWSAWGEAATRWNSLCDTAYPISKTHGSRFVTTRRLVQEDDFIKQLVVADFNPLLVRRSKTCDLDQTGLYSPGTGYDATTSGEWPNLESNPGARSMIVDYVDESRPTILDDISEVPIISRLPYRVTVVGGPTVAKFDDWMIDGNRLVGVKVGPVEGDSFDQFVVHYIRG
ncbi:hypothetical protein FRC12_008970 [Ceratobasidium sp. 428]|nr:hypothetical protein FRC12_008970 [Ceratobasidium sp. 428]